MTVGTTAMTGAATIAVATAIGTITAGFTDLVAGEVGLY
jgi:hypothetical protein